MPHLVDAQLAGAAEAVLDAAQDAVEVVLVALELQHGVHNVLQHLRSGQRAFLVYMSDEQDRGAAALGILEQGSRTLANLCERTGRGLHALRLYRLYGVDDDKVGLHLFDVLVYLFERRLAKDVDAL